MTRRVNILCSFALLFASYISLVITYPLLPEGSRLVEQSYTVTASDHNTRPLEIFAVQYRQGLSDILEANPGADIFLPKSSSQLAIPQQPILPVTVRKGIVVNAVEMRLCYHPPDSNTAEVFPIGVGQARREIPCNWVITAEHKQETPTWTPTLNARCRYVKRGESLPAFVPMDFDNPTGLYVIYIGRLYTIYGTSANFGTGLRVSWGYIYPHSDDIKHLLDNIPVGTRVQTIDQPVKHTTEPDGSNWLGAYESLSRSRAEYESNRKTPLPVASFLRAFISGQEVDVNRADAAL